MFSRILTFTVVCVCLAVAELMAQGVHSEAITIEQGLSQGMVFDICQTRDGFLWAATKDGLNRYDGYNFKIFTHDPFAPFSLAENTVTALFEDSRGWLWVGTESKGVDLYDRRSDRFYHFPLNFKRSPNASNFDVFTIVEALDGSICLLQHTGGLVRINIPAVWKNGLPNVADLSTQTAVDMIPVFTPAGKEEEVLVGLEVQANGHFLVCSPERAYTIDPATAVARAVDSSEWSRVRNGNNTEWWVPLSFSVACFRNGRPVVPDFPPSLKIKWTIVKPAAGANFWVAVNNHLWHLSQGEVIDFSNPDWVVEENISSVASDRNGNIWVGTQGYGLRKFNPRKQLFHKGAAGTSIWGLWRDERGKYYCKVVNEVFPYDPVKGAIGAERIFPEGPRRLLDMLMEPGGAMWMLGRGEAENGLGELRHYDPATGLSPACVFQFNSYVYARLFRDRRGDLWVTGLNCQLVRFNPESARFDHFSYASLFGEKANTVRAFALAEDGNGTFWIGTQHGLVKGVLRDGAFDFQLLQTDAGHPEGLSNNSIACLLPDPVHPGSVLWVGTKGGGINRLDLKTNRFQHITTKDGLPDNVIYGILPGENNDFWCSTNRGLFRLNPHLGTGEGPPVFDITTFTAAQGLQDNEFNTHAFFKAANGELLFGGVNGVNHFFSQDVRLDTTPPPVFVVGLQINHETVAFGTSESPLVMPFEYSPLLDLTHDQNNLSFEFAALDFTDPSQNRYRYRLVGLDPDWVETGTNRFAHFNHLSPGRYTLLVQGSNGEGTWQNASNPVSIVIHPPWWRSKIAYLLYTLLLLYAIWQAYRFQIRRVHLREQLAFEQRETERIKALEEMKTNFFSNVTHEFRTPLTLILEPVRRILAKTREPEVRENARLIEVNSQRLLGLVNQLLDLAKLEHSGQGLDLRLADFSETIRTVFRSFLPLAEQRGIRLTLKIEVEIPTFLFDAGKVELVLNNLISNALKFTPEGGTVTVTCRGAELPEAIPGVQVSVGDTGVGIPATAMSRIFDRFYQVDGPGTGKGTGIGLALSKELVELMGGQIAADSEPGKGSVFSFVLPARKHAPTAVAEQETTTGTPENEPTPEAAQTERSSVLLIEDNAELRGFIRQCIADTWDVVEASNGEEGVRKAQELIPDLVISDLMMPVRDGYAVCEDLKNGELTAHIPVILLTAKSALDSRVRGLRTGADDYLVKPFNTEELLARMENLVVQRRRLREYFGRQSAEMPVASDDAKLLTAPDREFLRRFVQLIDQNLSDETIGVEDLAEKMYISRVQLHRKLKALTDRNVSDFVRDYRLDRAMAMLKNREGLVYEVAARVGFGSEKYFSRAFKEKFGIPPGKVS